MRAHWDTHREMRLTSAFILALLFGGKVTPTMINPNQPGDLADLNDLSLRLIVEEGRRQLKEQAERFKHATDRAQVLLTVSLAVLAFAAGTLRHTGNVHGGRHWAALGIWSLAAVVTLLGVAAAASVIVVRADFSTVDTTNMTTWPEPVLRQLAVDYAEAVRPGEITVAARITMLRQATRIVCWAAIGMAIAYALAA